MQTTFTPTQPRFHRSNRCNQRLRSTLNLLPIRLVYTEDDMADDIPTVRASETPTVSTTTGTHWSVVLAAGKDSSPDARAAFGELYKAYSPPVLTYLYSKGNSPDHALDLLQGFFEHLLRTKGLTKVEKRGKFRSWLLSSLNHFATDVWAKENAQKRGGGKTHFPIGPDMELGELDPVDTRLTPEQAYDRKWAITLLERVLSKLAAEYAQTGKQKEFEEVKDFLPGGRAASGYEAIAARLGIKANTVAVYVSRLRTRYAELLRAEISSTVDPDMVEDEWRHLQEAVSGSLGTMGSAGNA
jgi:RNA polymerase sigma factor (sigma-70 family)